jgi:hypothetical protein
MRFKSNVSPVVLTVMLMVALAPQAPIAQAVPPVPDSPEPTTKVAKAAATSQPAILNPTYPPDFAEASARSRRSNRPAG